MNDLARSHLWQLVLINLVVVLAALCFAFILFVVLERAEAREQVVRESKRNRLERNTNTLVFSPAQAYAFGQMVSFYTAWFGPGNLLLRATYATRLGDQPVTSQPDRAGRAWLQIVKLF